ncbi:MAG TPA: GNAT family N-acetyltransferase [Myxococcaceae bacterium]|nr:GNAT family N-acetyltransferase [Myxococcaceae bacterium]
MFEPATDDDLSAIREHVQRFRLDGERLAADQFIVAREHGRLVAFGRVKPYGGGVFELGTVGVLESERGKGWGDRVVHELIRRFPTREVYITTDLTAYFERFGFERLPPDQVPAALKEKLQRICGTLRDGVVAMALTRPGNDS